MSQPGHREVEHEITVNVPAADVYRMLAEVENWPRIFPPTIYVDRVEQSTSSERIRIWATANDEVKTWTSRRTLDPDKLRIDFRQEVSQPPVAAMGGAWLIEAGAGSQSRVRLLHDYRAIDDDPDQLAWLDRAVDSNSRTELAALKTNLEAATGANERLAFSFEDAVTVNGAGRDVYDFINEAQLWQARLPHVARVVLTENDPGLQVLEMDTRTADGSTHTTKSVRICFPHQRIVYKQVALPALMTMHTGFWQISEDPSRPGSVKVTSQHTVSINEANITKLLGPDADLAQARGFVRKALGTNSMTTLQHAKDYAEALAGSPRAAATRSTA
jgi:aromatase